MSHQGNVTDVSSRCRSRKQQFVQRKYEGKRTLDKQQDDGRPDPLKPTYSWERDKSLYDGSAGRAQLVGVLNQDVQPHLSNTHRQTWKYIFQIQSQNEAVSLTAIETALETAPA